MKLQKATLLVLKNPMTKLSVTAQIFFTTITFDSDIPYYAGHSLDRAMATPPFENLINEGDKGYQLRLWHQYIFS